jgi:type I restriction enzyme S subunit
MELIQQFDLLASSLGGVAKLRELILSLAVRGKLVPQNPADEPASVLLQKIRAEKERLIVEGKIKKDKPLPPISDEEKPFGLPEGWEWVRLNELAQSQAGFAFKSNMFNDLGDGLPLIRIRDVGSNAPATYYSGEYREEFAVISGDWLISMDGEFRVAQWEGPKALLNQRVSRLIFIEKDVQEKLICIALQAELVKLQGQKAYTTVDHLSGGQISTRVIPLPPLPEQSRIVAKVDELMALCDRLEAEQGQAARVQGHWVEAALAQLAASAGADEFARHWQHFAQHFDTLFTTADSITQLEATLLQLAVRGKLVPQDPSDEPASALLQKIRTEKDRLIAEGKIKKDKPLPPISDEEKPFELPEGWAYARTYQIGESRLGKMLDQAKNSGSAHPYLRNTNVQWNRFELGDIKEIFLENHELDEYRLRNGDLLVCEGGEPGRCAIWRDEISDMYFQKALHRIRFFGNVLPEYFAICLEIDAKTGRLDQFFTGATIKHFAGQELNRYFVPLPPAAEQSRIVAKLESLFALTAGLKTQLAKAQQTQALLADVLLETSI